MTVEGMEGSRPGSRKGPGELASSVDGLAQLFRVGQDAGVGSDEFAGVLVSDSHATCYHHDGPKQPCCAYLFSSQGQALLRDNHDLRAIQLETASLTQWAETVHDIRVEAKPFTTRQSSSAASPNCSWNVACWRSVSC